MQTQVLNDNLLDARFHYHCRVESEMDIIIPPENENTSTAKSAKVRTPIKAPTPNPLKVC